MRSAFLFSFLLLLLAAGCNRGSGTDSTQQGALNANDDRQMERHLIEQLAWVEKADPDKMANQDIAAQRYRLFAVCLDRCDIAGVGALNAAHCYSRAVQERLEGASDTVLPGEHLRLTHKALEFASQYNRQVAAYLAEHGMSQCGSSADWDGALRSLTEFVWSLSKDGKDHGEVAVRADKGVFLVGLQAGISPASVLPQLCERLESSGLAAEAHLAIMRADQWDKPDSENLAKSYRCGKKMHAPAASSSAIRSQRS